MQKIRITMSSQEIDRLMVIKKLLQKELNQKEAAEKLSISVRQVKRLVKRCRQEGDVGICRKKQGGNRAFPGDFKPKVMAAVQAEYADFGPTLAAEKLAIRQQLAINRETLRQWMIAAGLRQNKKRKKARIHQSRARRSRYGELVQIDGSPHDWFEGRAPVCCLLVFIDDATSTILHARFEPSETTLGYFRAIHAYILEHGRPFSWYSDKDSIFITSRANQPDGIKNQTQFQRAMHRLDIKMIVAHSPQAKGRVERANQTLQDRLIKEMRLAGINSIEEANRFLPEFLKVHNAKFAVKASDQEDAHRPLTDSQSADLLHILSIQAERKLSKNLECRYNNAIYQVKRIGSGYSYRNANVTVCECMDGSIVLLKDCKLLSYEVIGMDLKGLQVAESKEVNALVDAMLAA